MLKDVGMEVPKIVETRKHPWSKTGEDGIITCKIQKM